MARCPAVIPVVQTPERKWDGVGKGANRNAASVEAGGAGALSPKEFSWGNPPSQALANPAK
jgi:hypothetical protein